MSSVETVSVMLSGMMGISVCTAAVIVVIADTIAVFIHISADAVLIRICADLVPVRVSAHSSAAGMSALCGYGSFRMMCPETGTGRKDADASYGKNRRGCQDTCQYFLHIFPSIL